MFEPVALRRGMTGLVIARCFHDSRTCTQPAQTRSRFNQHAGQFALADVVVRERTHALSRQLAKVVMWADDQFVEYGAFNPGLDVDHLVDTTRFELVELPAEQLPDCDQLADTDEFDLADYQRELLDVAAKSPRVNSAYWLGLGKLMQGPTGSCRSSAVGIKWQTPTLHQLLMAEHEAKFAEQEQRRIDEINQKLATAAAIDNGDQSFAALEWL